MNELSRHASVDSLTNQGHKALPWNAPKPYANLLKIDLDAIVSSAEPKHLIRSLPAQVLYHAIKSQGIGQCGKVISLMSADQFTRILDFDVWQKSMLKPQQALSWLMPLNELGPAAIANRFRSLEEEYQLAILDRMIQVFEPDDVENLPTDLQEGLIAFPGNTLYYRIIADDQATRDMISELINSAIHKDIGYAQSLLMHAASMPPNESELILSQFQRARLEEDGFVSFDEAQRIFIPVAGINIDFTKDTHQVSGLPILSHGQSSNYIEHVVDQSAAQGQWNAEDGFSLQQDCLHLGNALCSALSIDPSDIEDLNFILEHARALMGLGLDYLSHSDIAVASQLLKSQRTSYLFRVGLSLVYAFQNELIDRLAKETAASEDSLRSLRKFCQLHKWSQAQLTIDKELAEQLGLQLSEILKGVFKRFPMRGYYEATGTRIKFAPIGNLAEFYALQQFIDEQFSQTTRH